MRFNFHGLDDGGLRRLDAQAKSAGGALDRADYLLLEKPSENEPVRRYGAVDPDLYTRSSTCASRPARCA